MEYSGCNRNSLIRLNGKFILANDWRGACWSPEFAPILENAKYVKVFSPSLSLTVSCAIFMDHFVHLF